MKNIILGFFFLRSVQLNKRIMHVKKKQEKKKGNAAGILGSCLIMPMAVTLPELSHWSVCLQPSVPVRHYKVE